MGQGDGDDQRIYRYEGAADHRPGRDFEPAHGNEDTIAAIERHIEAHIGPIDTVFHEIISDLVHIDVHVVPATDDRPYAALVTSGMSDRPMTIPDDLAGEVSPHAEVVVLLPPDWPLDTEAWEDERHYWPVRWLKLLARFPHTHDTWLGHWHTMPNGDPAEPLSDDVPFTGVLILPPLVPGDDFRTLETDDGRSITFLTYVPLHQDEMDLKLAKGVDALLDAFEAAGVSELLDPARPSSVGGRRRRGLFRRR